MNMGEFWEDHDKKLKEYDKLKQENEKLRKCVEFYADEDTVYTAGLEHNATRKVCDIGGELARQTLKAINNPS